MSTGTYGATSIDLSGRVTLDAISNDNLDLEGNAGADVNITGVSDLTSNGTIIIGGTNNTNKLIVKDNGGSTIFRVDTTNGGFNNGTLLGGHAVVYNCEKNASASSGAGYAWGNGTNATTFGPVIPVDGTIRYVTISADASSTCTAAVRINGVASAATVSLSAATSNTATVNVSVTAGDFLGGTITSGTANTRSIISFIVIFD